MSDYPCLDRVEAEFLGEEEELAEEADRLLGEFFRGNHGAQYKAFLEEDLRHIVIPNGETVKIIQEEGDWIAEDLEPRSGNSYRLIYQENGYAKREKVSSQEAEAYLL